MCTACLDVVASEQIKAAPLQRFHASKIRSLTPKVFDFVPYDTQGVLSPEITANSTSQNTFERR